MEKSIVKTHLKGVACTAVGASTAIGYAIYAKESSKVREGEGKKCFKKKMQLLKSR